MSTEKQKMLSGEWYFPSDKRLFAEREAAKALCHRFNQLGPDTRKEGRSVIKTLFGSAPSAWVEPPFFCDYGYNIHTGKAFYANHGVTILDAAPVTFGEHVLLGPGVLISTATHPMEAAPRRKGLEVAYPITLGDDVWVGMGAKILPGVTIGDGAVIGAGAVVTKDVEAGTTVVGVPAHIR